MSRNMSIVRCVHQSQQNDNQSIPTHETSVCESRPQKIARETLASRFLILGM